MIPARDRSADGDAWPVIERHIECARERHVARSDRFRIFVLLGRRRSAPVVRANCRPPIR